MGKTQTAEKLAAQLEQIASENDTVSMSVAGVCGDEIPFLYAIGYSDIENRILATTDTVYRVASVSKPLACLAAMTLIDEEKAGLDRDIGDYLGYRVRNPYYPDMPITLRHLMTHTSTIIERGSYNRVLVGDLPAFKLSEILKEGGPGYCKENYLDAKPGERYDYSSFGTGIMGAVIERITGKKFAAYAHERIFNPLGLDAGFDPDELSGKFAVAKPYEVGGTRPQQDPDWLKRSLERKSLLYNLPVGEAYRIAQGNVHIRPCDLAVVMSVFFNGGSARGVRILSQKSIDEMLKVQFSDGRMTTGLNLWHMDYLVTGAHLLGHYGRAYGAQTAMAFDPIAKKGAVVFTNGTRDVTEGHTYHNLTCTLALRAVYGALDELS